MIKMRQRAFTFINAFLKMLCMWHEKPSFSPLYSPCDKKIFDKMRGVPGTLPGAPPLPFYLNNLCASSMNARTTGVASSHVVQERPNVRHDFSCWSRM